MFQRKQRNGYFFIDYDLHAFILIFSLAFFPLAFNPTRIVTTLHTIHGHVSIAHLLIELISLALRLIYELSSSVGTYLYFPSLLCRRQVDAFFSCVVLTNLDEQKWLPEMGKDDMNKVEGQCD